MHCIGPQVQITPSLGSCLSPECLWRSHHRSSEQNRAGMYLMLRLFCIWLIFPHFCHVLTEHIVVTVFTDKTFCFIILQTETTETTQDRPSTSQATSLPEMPESETSSSLPPPKKSAMAEVFGSLFATGQRNHPDLRQKVKEEVYAYVAKESTSVESDPRGS